MHEFESVSVPDLDDAQLASGFPNGIFRADAHATTATVAQFDERQHCAAEHHNRLELTYLCAFAAKGALLHVHFGNRGGDGLDPRDIGFDKKMRVGLFHVTIQQLDIVAQADGQIGGDGGLAGSALAAGDTDDHVCSSVGTLI